MDEELKNDTGLDSTGEPEAPQQDIPEAETPAEKTPADASTEETYEQFNDTAEEPTAPQETSYNPNNAQQAPGSYPPPPQNGYGYNQPPYGNPPYGQPPYGQPPYGQQPYGQQPYGGRQAPPPPPYGSQQYAEGNAQNNGTTPPPYNPYAQGQSTDGDEPKSSGGKKKTGIIIAIVVVVLAIVLGIVFTVVDFSSSSSSDSADEDEATSEYTGAEASTVASAVTSSTASEVYESYYKSNVGVLIYAESTLYTQGSGIIALEDEDNGCTYIMTCAHVVENDTTYTYTYVIELYDGTQYEAELVGYDSKTDIGVLKIEVTGLQVATFGDSDALVIGQTVYAVGNPGGTEFANSITTGIISAIDRPVDSSTGYEMECIQHDAAINPGNSGGALLNEYGEVIGVNSSKISSTDYEGMGFAVPSSVAVEVFNEIIQNGYVTGRAKLGISYAAATSYQTYGMYVTIMGLPSGSIVIASISEDSDLVNYDVQVGDIIIAVDGEEMTETGVLAEKIEDMSAGDTLTLTIVRVDTTTWESEQFDVTVELVEDTGS